MPRKAFLLGRNTGRLRHCLAYDKRTEELAPCDVQLIQVALEKHGYQVSLAEKDVKVGDIHTQLCEFIDDCAEEDTLVVYFSGHSVIRGAELCLVLADPPSKTANRLAAQTVIGLLEGCEAGEKLLILDCCDAGQSTFDWSPGNSDRFRVLTATGQLGESKEFEELEAGVFTYHLYKALTEAELWSDDEAGVLNSAGELRVSRLYQWLKDEVPAYGRGKDRKVLTPDLYGAASKDILLAEHLPIYRHTFLSPARLEALKELLTKTGLSNDFVGNVFRQSLREIRTGSPFDCDEENLDCLLDYLVDMGYRDTEDMPVPLLEFVARLRDRAANRQALDAWIQRAAQELKRQGLTEEQIAALGRSRIQAAQAPYVLVELAPNDDNGVYYSAQSWVLDNFGRFHSAYVQDSKFRLEKMPELLTHVYEHSKVKDIRTDPNASYPLTFEFFLPQKLLDADAQTEQWRLRKPNEAPEAPLGFHHCVVLRAWERQRRDLWIENWAHCWNENSARLEDLPSDACLEWLEEADGSYAGRLDDGIIAFVLRRKLSEDDVIAMLRAGVAIILWPFETLSREAESQLRRQLERHKLGQLPEALRKARRRLWESQQQTGQLRLLWDDPHRKLPALDSATRPLLNPNEDY